MKHLLIVLPFTLLISCSKSALVPQNYHAITHHWVAQSGHDVTSFDHAAFCFPEDYGAIDTVELVYSKQPNDTTKFSYQVGSIYFGSRTETNTPGIFDRYYNKLLKQID